jgi:anti-sigma factor RsiW
MDCHDIRDDIDLCALGTLPPDEAERVRAHAATCADCQAELLAAEDAVARLALAVPRVPAPAALREAVFAAVRGPAGVAHRRRRWPWRIRSRPAQAVARGAPAPGLGLLHLLGRRVSARFGAVAAAVVLLPLAGLLAWTTVLQRQVNELRDETAQIQRRNEGLLLLASPSTARADFRPVGDARGATGSATWNPDRRVCFVFFDHLPEPEAGAAYRLWYSVDGRITVDGGRVVRDDNGRAEVIIDASNWRGQTYELILKLERTPHDPGAVPILMARLVRP